jgi:hypothetical protein
MKSFRLVVGSELLKGLLVKAPFSEINSLVVSLRSTNVSEENATSICRVVDEAKRETSMQEVEIKLLRRHITEDGGLHNHCYEIISIHFRIHATYGD